MIRHALLVLLSLAAAPAAAADAPFAIRVVDESTGRGVPLVELETTNNVVYVTDSAGYVALSEPALVGRKVFFTVRSHGYEFAKDGFGYPGKALEVSAGGEATLKIKRVNIAERLYRVTGADIYRDSVLLGRPVPIKHPLLNAQVMGSDSVLTTIYRGKIRWFWGDTNRPSYPLGLFHVPGAVSDLPTAGGLDPAKGVDLTYFVGPEGFARATAELPGSGPTWLTGLTVLKDDSGRERMFAAYAKIKPPLSTYERGIVKWNDKSELFEKVKQFPLDDPARPDGHPFLHTDAGVEYVYFATPYPLVRVRATPEAFIDPAAYESYTPLAAGTSFDEKNPNAAKLDRADDGTLRYGWKKKTAPLGATATRKLIDAGLIKPEEARHALRDRESGKAVLAHGGSVYRNEFRKKWVMLFVELFGKPSNLGEVWYSEADAPEGPWVYATKVATHDRQDFYNPKQHPMFDAEGGKVIYFEGTYTNSFSGNPAKTPRYEYNQMMYRLDLADERLAIPVAVHHDAERRGFTTARATDNSADTSIAFYALDRSARGAIPVFAQAGPNSVTLSTEPPLANANASPAFYVLPPDASDAPPATTPLYEFVSPATEERRYSTESAAPAGFVLHGTLGRVWSPRLSPPAGPRG